MVDCCIRTHPNMHLSQRVEQCDFRVSSTNELYAREHHRTNGSRECGGRLPCRGRVKSDGVPSSSCGIRGWCWFCQQWRVFAGRLYGGKRDHDMESHGDRKGPCGKQEGNVRSGRLKVIGVCKCNRLASDGGTVYRGLCVMSTCVLFSCKHNWLLLSS